MHGQCCDGMRGSYRFCFVVVVCAAMSDERFDDGWFVVEPANAHHHTTRIHLLFPPPSQHPSPTPAHEARPFSLKTLVCIRPAPISSSRLPAPPPPDRASRRSISLYTVSSRAANRVERCSFGVLDPHHVLTVRHEYQFDRLLRPQVGLIANVEAPPLDLYRLALLQRP